MAIRAESGTARRAATRSVAAEPVSFGEPGGADDLSVILVPTACLDAALALAQRMGVPVAAVIGLALQRLNEDALKRGL
jgi:hypothetical protein